MPEPPSGLQRSRTAAGASTAKVEKEKRKRSRVTPEQLVHLERFFAMDRSPTASRRKEISDMLGMQERQTQIWFQNRRAKAKLQDGKKGRGRSTETPPDTPPQLVTGYEAELHNLLHEDEPVTIIPCTDLSVGTWRRIATTPRNHDLVAYLSDTKRCLSWFIHSSGCSFKMEIPFDIIVNTEFTNAAPGSGLASFFLSKPPTFYLQSSPPTNSPSSTGHIHYWKKCADWTQDQQATKVLRHNLVGSAVQLAHVLRHLNTNISGSDIRLHSPGYTPQEPSPPTLEIQPPPLAAFPDTGRHYHPGDSVELCQSDQPTLTHKRSFSSSASSQRLSLHDPLQHSIEQSPSGAILEPDPPMYPQYSQHPAIAQLVSYSNHPEIALPLRVPPSSHPTSRGVASSFPAHSSHQRPYSAGSVHSLSFENGSRILSFPDSLAPTPFGTPSPPLLTTPFYPAGSVPNACSSTYDPAIPISSGLPGISMSGTHSPKSLLQQ